MVMRVGTAVFKLLARAGIRCGWLGGMELIQAYDDDDDDDAGQGGGSTVEIQAYDDNDGEQGGGEGTAVFKLLASRDEGSTVKIQA
jgi:hypothetical protein